VVPGKQGLKLEKAVFAASGSEGSKQWFQENKD